MTVFDNVFPRRKLSVTPRNKLSSEKRVHVRNSQRNSIGSPMRQIKRIKLLS